MLKKTFIHPLQPNFADHSETDKCAALTEEAPLSSNTNAIASASALTPSTLEYTKKLHGSQRLTTKISLASAKVQRLSQTQWCDRPNLTSFAALFLHSEIANN